MPLSHKIMSAFVLLQLCFSSYLVEVAANLVLLEQVCREIREPCSLANIATRIVLFDFVPRGSLTPNPPWAVKIGC